jgi:hypothetical protein
MELHRYWRVIRSRLWLVLGLPLLVAASYPLVHSEPLPTYAAGMRFVVGVRPEVSDGDYYTYDRYYTWLTAEYLVDDLAEVVKSRRFAEDGGRAGWRRRGARGHPGRYLRRKCHRILQVSITWPNPDELARIASAAQDLLVSGADAYFAQLGTDSAVVELIDPPGVYQVGRSLRDRLDLPLGCSSPWGPAWPWRSCSTTWMTPCGTLAISKP